MPTAVWINPSLSIGNLIEDDGLVVVIEPDHPRWGEFLALNPVTLEPPPPEPPPPPTAEEMLAAFTKAIDAHVEATARTRRYNGAAHMASYVASTVPVWAAEAQAFVAWRDQVWLYSLTELDAIQTGAKPIPDLTDFLAALPAPIWPQ